jgi:hypothetical protein
MIDGRPVAIVIDGRRVDASRAARLEQGVVVAPFDPFVRDIAERIDGDGSGRRFTIVRGSRSIAITIGRRSARANDFEVLLPIAPALHGTEPFAPLAVVVRALGGSVAYDPASRVLVIATVPGPVTTMTPAASQAPAGPRETFAPKETEPPAPTLTGIPRPRRTPIVECGKAPR